MPARKFPVLASSQHDLERDQLRWEVLEAIHQLAPHVLTSLRDDYRRNPSDATVRTWARSHAIERPWISGWASYFARLWAARPEFADPLTWYTSAPVDWETFTFPTDELEYPAEADNLLTPPGANPLYETLEEYLGRAQRHYRAWHDQLLSEGFVKVRTPPLPRFQHQPWQPGQKTFFIGGRKTRLHRHADWLVRFKFLSWTYEQIAEASNVSEKSVQKAVAQLASLIDLPTTRPPQS